MPVGSASFTLKPVGFFTADPAIDIPYHPNAASKLCCGFANGSAANIAVGAVPVEAVPIEAVPMGSARREGP